MNLIVFSPGAFCPVIIHRHHMKGAFPFHQILGDIKIAKRIHTSNIILAIIFHHPGVGHFREHRILNILSEQTLAPQGNNHDPKEM